MRWRCGGDSAHALGCSTRCCVRRDSQGVRGLGARGESAWPVTATTRRDGGGGWAVGPGLWC